MYIARDHDLTPDQERLFSLYKMTYPTDQTKFTAYREMAFQNDQDGSHIRKLIRQISLCREALFRISRADGKNHKNGSHDLAWCKSLAEYTLTSINAKE